MNPSLAKDRFTLLDAPNSCIDCHSKLENKRLSAPVSLWSKSVHAEVGNTCDGCHGGDSDDHTENSMSAAKNFIAVPQEDDIVKLCGKCNQGLSDNFMTSAHGATGQPTCSGITILVFIGFAILTFLYNKQSRELDWFLRKQFLGPLLDITSRLNVFF